MKFREHNKLVREVVGERFDLKISIEQHTEHYNLTLK